MIKAVLFDFGGVLAEEGFREGLKAIGVKNGLDPDDFF
jgi:putative hydrolase of the HAD superfamily